MLGRTANDLYWLSRYIERAENMARLVEVGYRIVLLPREGAGYHQEWRSTLQSTGCEAGYFAKYSELETRNVVNFLLFDPDNPSSVYSCLARARHNARAQRTAVTRDMWESLNSSWIELAGLDTRDFAPNRLPHLLDWIKERSALYRGALLNTILRNDTYYFSELGTFIERADNTARILDVKYYVLLPQIEMIGTKIDNYQWTAILRSVSAHRSYRWVYKENVKPWRIAHFLILNKQMPRSLAYCYEEIPRALEGLRSFYGSSFACQVTAADTCRMLEFSDVNQIFQTGLHEFLQEFLTQNNRLASEISEAYHIVSRAESHADLGAPCHALHLRRPGAIRRAEPAADAAIFRRAVGQVLVAEGAGHRECRQVSRCLRQSQPTGHHRRNARRGRGRGLGAG